jgi:hypothetical protein
VPLQGGGGTLKQRFAALIASVSVVPSRSVSDGYVVKIPILIVTSHFTKKLPICQGFLVKSPNFSFKNQKRGLFEKPLFWKIFFS